MTDNFNPKNSIWPNGSKVDENGYVTFYPLGTNKIDVPTTGWPKGTKLVAPFVYDKDNRVVGFCDTKAMTTANGNANIYLPYELIQADFSSIEKGTLGVYAPKAIVKNALWADGTVSDFPEAQYKYKGRTTVNDVKAVDPNYLNTDIVDGVWSEPLWSLTDGNYMFNWCDNLTTFSSDLPNLTDGGYMFQHCYNLTAFNANLSNLTNGDGMFFYCSKLTSFSSDLSNLTNGYHMFYRSGLESFSSNLSSLTNGDGMFYYCENLESFSSDLSSLTDGGYMFRHCYNLTAFSSDLSSLTNGSYMFFCCENLTSFTSDLSSLTNGEEMFMYCSNLESFSSDLSSLTNGYSMFYGCSKLASFSSDLSSLTSGNNMFRGCKLDTASVQHIADTINTHGGAIHIDIANSEPNEEENAAFEQIADKEWDVYVNGSSLHGCASCCATCCAEDESTCCAICCASLTTLDEDDTEHVAPKPYWAKPVPATEETASYVDANGNYYNILGGQYIYVKDPETYGMFTSLEDAQAQMRLTKYVKGEEPVIIETA